MVEFLVFLLSPLRSLASTLAGIINLLFVFVFLIVMGVWGEIATGLGEYGIGYWTALAMTPLICVIFIALLIAFYQLALYVKEIVKKDDQIYDSRGDETGSLVSQGKRYTIYRWSSGEWRFNKQER